MSWQPLLHGALKDDAWRRLQGILDDLSRAERDVVRRFVKPVKEIERDDGSLVAMSGHRVTEVGAAALPVLASAAGYLVCALTQRVPLGSHTLCIGEVVEVGGEPSDVLRMEDTRMHYGG